MFNKKPKTDAKKGADDAANEGLSATEVVALAKQFPNAIERIETLGNEGKNADEIEAVLKDEKIASLEASLKSKDEEIAALAEKSQAGNTDQASQVEQLTKERDELQAKVEKSASWENRTSANEDPGPDAQLEDDIEAGDASDATVKAQWRALSPSRQEEFGSYDAFAWLAKNDPEQIKQ